MTVEAEGTQKKKLPVPTKNGNRIASIIRRGLNLIQKLEASKQAIEENNKQLIPHAENLTEKTGLKQAVFKSEDGKVTVKFGENISYNDDDVAKIKGILGPIFGQMFHEIPGFAVNIEDIPEIKKRLGADFGRLVAEQKTYKHTPDLLKLIADGDSDIARRLRDVIRIEAKKPSVKFETLVK